MCFVDGLNGNKLKLTSLLSLFSASSFRRSLFLHTHSDLETAYPLIHRHLKLTKVSSNRFLSVPFALSLASHPVPLFLRCGTSYLVLFVR